MRRSVRRITRPTLVWLSPVGPWTECNGWESLVGLRAHGQQYHTSEYHPSPGRLLRRAPCSAQQPPVTLWARAYGLTPGPICGSAVTIRTTTSSSRRCSGRSWRSRGIGEPAGGVAPACAARILDWVGCLHCLPARWVQSWLACGVLLKIVYLPTCRVLGLAVLGFRGDRTKDAELLYSGTRTPCCAGISAGYGTSWATACGSPRLNEM